MNHASCPSIRTGLALIFFCVKYPTSREKLHVERVQRSSKLIGRQDPSFVQPFDVFRRTIV
jgi:hypothetical protein